MIFFHTMSAVEKKSLKVPTILKWHTVQLFNSQEYDKMIKRKKWKLQQLSMQSLKGHPKREI